MAVVVVIEDNLPSQGSPVLLVQMSSILCHFCVRGTNKLTSDLAFYLYLSLGTLCLESRFPEGSVSS